MGTKNTVNLSNVISLFDKKELIFSEYQLIDCKYLLLALVRAFGKQKMAKELNVDITDFRKTFQISSYFFKDYRTKMKSMLTNLSFLEKVKQEKPFFRLLALLDFPDITIANLFLYVYINFSEYQRRKIMVALFKKYLLEKLYKELRTSKANTSLFRDLLKAYYFCYA